MAKKNRNYNKEIKDKYNITLDINIKFHSDLLIFYRNREFLSDKQINCIKAPRQKRNRPNRFIKSSYVDFDPEYNALFASTYDWGDQ